jgi:hypothetical protein
MDDIEILGPVKMSFIIDSAAMYRLYLYKLVDMMYRTPHAMHITQMHLLLRSPLSLVSNPRLHHVLVDIPLLPRLVS